MPILLAQSSAGAKCHLWSGILLRSKTVPTATLNCLRQAAHFHTPGRWASAFSA